MADGSLSRRELLRRTGGAGALLALPAAARADAAATPTLPIADTPALPDVYGAIGVRPLINGRGTFTIISGSTMLPEVRAAMDAASRHYVHLDELAEAIGARLATLTQAEWGLVTSGCSAGLTHATAACVAGGNPELHVRIPNLQGFAKDEVIIPSHSRNVYDAAIRAVGVRVVDGVDRRRARGGDRAADGDDLRAGQPRRRQERAERQGDGADRQGQGRADPGRRRRRDPDHPQRPPGQRRDARRLQRRQVPARSADRGSAARPQGSGQGGLGPQRAAPRPASRLQGRQGRSDRDAGRGRGLGEARPRRRVEALDRLARTHRGQGEDRRRRDHRNRPAGRPVEQDAVAPRALGSRQAGRRWPGGRPHAVQRRAAHHHDRRGRRRGRRSIGDGRHRRLDHAHT